MNLTQTNQTGLCKLGQFALISATGADASSFLHSQLTNDIQLLPQNRACLAGYCTPKGRLLASFLVWKTADAIVLEIPAELQESTQKRLQIFVMRAKVKLDRDAQSILGILGEDVANQLSPWFPTLPQAPYDVIHADAGVLIRLADAQGVARYQWVLSNNLLEQLWPTLSVQLPVLPEHVWALSEIHAGIPQITVATQEKFVPQMVNYELIGGVNFKKGCYPGQEIVARSHYLGKQKRRMALARIDCLDVQSGMEVFASDDESQPCGMVVNTQSNDQGGCDCLVEIKMNYLSSEVKLANGGLCHWLPMPYSLPID